MPEVCVSVIVYQNLFRFALFLMPGERTFIHPEGFTSQVFAPSGAKREAEASRSSGADGRAFARRAGPHPASIFFNRSLMSCGFAFPWVAFIAWPMKKPKTFSFPARYWDRGPQTRLYCPAPWLKQGVNEILVFDLLQMEPQTISGKKSLM